MKKLTKTGRHRNNNSKMGFAYLSVMDLCVSDLMKIAGSLSFGDQKQIIGKSSWEGGKHKPKLKALSILCWVGPLAPPTTVLSIVSFTNSRTFTWHFSHDPKQPHSVSQLLMGIAHGVSV